MVYLAKQSPAVLSGANKPSNELGVEKINRKKANLTLLVVACIRYPGF